MDSPENQLKQMMLVKVDVQKFISGSRVSIPVLVPKAMRERSDLLIAGYDFLDPKTFRIVMLSLVQGR